MKSKHHSFQSLLLAMEPYVDLGLIFQDFLTVALCMLSVDTQNGRPSPFVRELYRKSTERYRFLGCGLDPFLTYKALNREMNERKHTILGNDLLGEFYQEYLMDRQATGMLLPWPLCVAIARRNAGHGHKDLTAPQVTLDTTCRTGRMLLASAYMNDNLGTYYGIDTEEQYVKIAALNLLLNGIYGAEVLWIDTETAVFNRSYATSFRPFGIRRIDNSQDSALWKSMEDNRCLFSSLHPKGYGPSGKNRVPSIFSGSFTPISQKVQ